MEACSIAAAFWDEACEAGAETRLESRAFLQEAARLSRTKHEHDLNSVFEKFNLTMKVPMHFVDLGTASTHPTFRPVDLVSSLVSYEKLHLLLRDHSGQDLEDFWAIYRLGHAAHPVYTEHQHNLKSCLPVLLFGDEGTSQKRKALMVLEWQPLLGSGSARAQDLNMLGVSTTNRFLYSVLMSKEYSGKKRANEPLHKLVDHLATEFRSCFYDGIAVKNVAWTKRIYLICLGLKGDLQGIVKLGKLTRNFMRDSASAKSAGICHLCLAGHQGKPWHEHDFQVMSGLKRNLPPPWASEPSLIAKIPQIPSRKHEFFKVDLFHTLHKGFFGDIAANSIVPGTRLTYTLLCLGSYISLLSTLYII